MDTESFASLLNRRSLYVKGFDRFLDASVVRGALEALGPATGQIKVVVPIDQATGATFGYAYANFLSANAEEDGRRLGALGGRQGGCVDFPGCMGDPGPGTAWPPPRAPAAPVAPPAFAQGGVQPSRRPGGRRLTSRPLPATQPGPHWSTGASE
jgi:hypothetical protein